MNRALFRLFFVVVPAVLVTSCSPGAPKVDPGYRARIEAAWNQREARLVADDGWLTVVGLTWLEPGLNTVGSAPETTVRLPEIAPPVVGVLQLDDENGVTLVPEDRVEITVNGGPAATVSLATDAAGTPDVVRAGRILFYIIQRGDRIGVRVKDPEAPARRSFAGIGRFPVDPAYRVTAKLEPYPEPREVAVPTAIGTPSTMLAPGVLHFTIDGASLSLEPYVSTPDDGELFIVFRDRTSGSTTYGAGRFLSSDRVEGSTEVVLDFNLAVNPPCAFTPYATCPLPTPENTLPVAIEAGETFHGIEH